MHHCPYCGTKVRDNEAYCIKCGKNLPEDMHERLDTKQQFNKYWYIPIAVAAVIILAIGGYYIFQQQQTAEAKELYKKAEENAVDENYDQASTHLKSALDKQASFSQADTLLSYVQTAQTIEEQMNQVDEHLDQEAYQDALSIINDAENKLTTYIGEAVNPLINKLTEKRSAIKLEQLRFNLEQEPGINDLKTLLWEADAIQTDKATEVADNIRGQIVDHTFAQASEQLKDKQFSDALLLVEDGLKYAPESEKLQSLKTTIEKEKTAFETAQQHRIEQAINSAEAERKLNENDAIELVEADVTRDDQGNAAVKGQVQSVATIPINSILIEYDLMQGDEKLLSNEVYAYPDTLFPDETGEFEFTHFDIAKRKNLSVTINQIRWYTDHQ
ncbi:zinc-ribbon domain-containing protein [Lentibacillus persicus]|uniref:Zinc-ribbon domain-containing protein n=1 Tax=Lentibacillus persicus TaxID=640948 RepID=A0A1I1SK34_9BACI|nr:zinc ribbon domain-containing protein [Lentibacillus persicus]SFD46845.1 zinc-ribbon domain-containing protein [Lentibacillus persicus]